MPELTDFRTHMTRREQREQLSETMTEAMRNNRRPSDLMMLPVDWRREDLTGGWLVEQKFDGIHTGFSARSTGVQQSGAFTREGVPFIGSSHLFPALRAVEREMQRLDGRLHLLFGEYCHPAGFEAAVGDLRRGEGAGVLMLFDAVTDEAWRGQLPSEPLIQRRQLLVQAVAAAGVTLSNGGIAASEASLYLNPSAEMIEVLAGSIWAEGHEGIVLKAAHSPYSRGPSLHWQRLKRQETVDLPITGAEVDSGRLRAFTVAPGEGLVARIGRGISDALRRAPHLFRTGRVAEIKHLGRTAKGNLRSASFSRFRDDRSTGN